MAAPSLLIAVAMAALLVSCCDASRYVPQPAGAGEVVLHRVHNDPLCEVMVHCNVLDCTQYCVNVGLHQKGFCTAKPDLNFYCCCPVVSN